MSGAEGFDANLAEVELTFPDAVHKLDAGDCSRSIPEALEPEHRSQPKFDESMILFDEIVQIF
jgi:hypothetical protein